MNACINTTDDFSTYDKNLVNVGPVTPSFAFVPGGLHAGLLHAFLVIIWTQRNNLRADNCG